MNSSLITIGIPFLNNEKTLKNAIISIIKQTHNNLEIILIDDGSTDSSLKIAKAYASQDNRISVISDGKNLGLISRLNQIIHLAQGEFIARMDADDLMDSERLEKQINYFSSNPNADVVTTGLISLNDCYAPVGKRCCDSETPDMYKVFKNGEGLLHASMLSRTKWSRANMYQAGFDRAEDRELFTRTLGHSIYLIIKEPLYFYLDVQNMSLEKYLLSYKSERLSIVKNWRGKIYLPQVIFLYFRSLLKSFLIRFYFLFGVEHLLFVNKNCKLTIGEEEIIKLKIQEIIK